MNEKTYKNNFMVQVKYKKRYEQWHMVQIGVNRGMFIDLVTLNRVTEDVFKFPISEKEIINYVDNLYGDLCEFIKIERVR